MSKIRDITGMCFELPNVEFRLSPHGFNGIVAIDDRTIFTGTILECYGFVSGLKFNAKAVQVHDLLEKICRGNIEQGRKCTDRGSLEEAYRKWEAEVEEVYLSDDEVNDKAIKENQG